VENQAAADERIPLLLQTPAAVRFLSCEPLLGPIEFSDVSRRADAVEQLGRRALAGINWVIIGGESGPSARPMELAWMRFIVRQCQAVQVAVFCKQLGYRASDPTNGIAGAGLNVPEEASGLISLRLRDKKGGDMREWPNDLRIRSFPTPAP
jgi:protein gp37